MWHIPLYLLTERGESTGDEEGGPTAYSRLLMKVYNALHFKSAERREGIRDEERGPTAYYCYVEAS